MMEQLIVVLAQLSMANSTELRELTGMMVVTHLVPVESAISKACLLAGQEYQSSVASLRSNKEVKKKKEAGVEATDPEELGSPHICIALQGLVALMQDPLVAEAKRADLKKWWLSKIQGKNEEEAKGEILMWRLRKPQKSKPVKMGNRPAGEFAKLTCSFKDPAVELLVCQCLADMGSVRKRGTAPRGWLEREASRLLRKVQKGKD